ncbi:MAG: pantetheine-phosphate adenylyltransferase [Croceicoccus sp.]|nr:pantetheine-phosphate adenylyltransferase [Croceicoccus sp.]MAL25589.1 pantetheine-phosphate adenylyltransferase [Croceicoccus sp.]
MVPKRTCFGRSRDLWSNVSAERTKTPGQYGQYNTGSRNVSDTRAQVGIYPGTFDPITLGHCDIIRRGAKLVDRLIIGVTTNPSKNPMFSPEERMEMVEREVKAMGVENVEVVGFNALLMHFAEKQGAQMIVRGLRAVADFEYEYQMAGMNQQLNDDIETVFLMADVSLQPIASRLVKEIAQFGGDISRFVSPSVKEDVVERVARQGLKGDR